MAKKTAVKRVKRNTSLEGLKQAHAVSKMRRSLLHRAFELRERAARYEEIAAEIKNGLLRQS